MSHKYQIKFNIRGNDEEMEYTCPFFNTETPDDKFATDPQSALRFFHNYMQRLRKIPHDAYTITAICDSYLDFDKKEVFRRQDVPATSNPDVSPKKREPKKEESMLELGDISEESLCARDKFINSHVIQWNQKHKKSCVGSHGA